MGQSSALKACFAIGFAEGGEIAAFFEAIMGGAGATDCCDAGSTLVVDSFQAKPNPRDGSEYCFRVAVLDKPLRSGGTQFIGPLLPRCEPRVYRLDVSSPYCRGTFRG